MRLKHNKKRNIVFVYEALIRELTKSVVQQNKARAKTVSNIILESFKKGTKIHEELSIYKSICEAVELTERQAEKVILESKIAYEKVSKSDLFKEHTSLINKINKTIGSQVFNSFVPNFKSMASVYSIFNNDLPPKDRVLLEEKIVGTMTCRKEKESSKLDHVDEIVYKNFVSKFNEKYSDTLLENQKSLLNRYISSFNDGGLELKIFINEELNYLKTKLNNSKMDDIMKQDGFLDKIEQVESMIDSFKKESLNESMIKKVIKIQKLVSEITK